MDFWHGVGAAIALYLFCRWVGYMAPLGDPETGAGRQEIREGKTRTNVKANRQGSNSPPPAPPKARPPPGSPHAEWEVRNNYAGRIYQMSAREGVDELTVRKATGDWLAVEMVVNGGVAASTITLRSRGMAQQLHFMLGQALGVNS